MRYFLIVLLLSGCSAIKVTEVDGSCTLSGSVIEPRATEAPKAAFELVYYGDRCSVRVSNAAE